MIDSTKLIELAARGIPQVQIAKALGITEGRLSQLLSDERVQKRITEKEAELAATELDSITSLERINSNLLKRMDDLVEESESLGEVVAAYEKLSRMQAQKRGGNIDTEDSIRRISIQIPIFLQQAIEVSTSPRNEIIDINKRSMATMPTVAVHKLIKTHAKQKATSSDPLEGVDPSTVEF